MLLYVPNKSSKSGSLKNVTLDYYLLDREHARTPMGVCLGHQGFLSLRFTCDFFQARNTYCDNALSSQKSSRSQVRNYRDSNTQIRTDAYSALSNQESISEQEQSGENFRLNPKLYHCFLSLSHISLLCFYSISTTVQRSGSFLFFQGDTEARAVSYAGYQNPQHQDVQMLGEERTVLKQLNTRWWSFATSLSCLTPDKELMQLSELWRTFSKR